MRKNTGEIRRGAEIETKEIKLITQVECLKAKMGDPKATKNVLAIVKGTSKLVPVLNLWTCPMHPQIRRDVKGRCPICAMKLVGMLNLRTDQDKESQVIALGALSEIRYPKVAQLARDMLTDDFSAVQRIDIASICVKTEPKKGWPHFSIFLHSSNVSYRQIALATASQDFPQLFVEEFQAIVNDPTRSVEERYYAAEGLAISGKLKYFATIRGVASKKISGNPKALSESDIAKFRAIHFLAIHGDETDIELLEPVLDEKIFNRIAARAILTIMYRLEKKN